MSVFLSVCYFRRFTKGGPHLPEVTTSSYWYAILYKIYTSVRQIRYSYIIFGVSTSIVRLFLKNIDLSCNNILFDVFVLPENHLDYELKYHN